jgi:hypothetical protein
LSNVCFPLNEASIFTKADATLVDLLASMLDPNPVTRITASDMLHHEAVRLTTLKSDVNDADQRLDAAAVMITRCEASKDDAYSWHARVDESESIHDTNDTTRNEDSDSDAWEWIGDLGDGCCSSSSSSSTRTPSSSSSSSCTAKPSLGTDYRHACSTEWTIPPCVPVVHCATVSQWPRRQWNWLITGVRSILLVWIEQRFSVCVLLNACHVWLEHLVRHVDSALGRARPSKWNALACLWISTKLLSDTHTSAQDLLKDRHVAQWASRRLNAAIGRSLTPLQRLLEAEVAVVTSATVKPTNCRLLVKPWTVRVKGVTLNPFMFPSDTSLQELESRRTNESCIVSALSKVLVSRCYYVCSQRQMTKKLDYYALVVGDQTQLHVMDRRDVC